MFQTLRQLRAAPHEQNQRRSGELQGTVLEVDQFQTLWVVRLALALINSLHRVKFVQPAVRGVHYQLPAYDVAIANCHSGEVIF